MSAPARSLAPAPAPRKRAVPSPVVPAARPRPSTPPQVRRPARRGSHPAFWLFSAAVVSTLLIGVVALNTMLVQTTYRMQTVQKDVADLADRQVVLSDEAATLSAPSRVAEWARQHQMVMPAPGDTVILSVPGDESANPGSGT